MRDVSEIGRTPGQLRRRRPASGSERTSVVHRRVLRATGEALRRHVIPRADGVEGLLLRSDCRGPGGLFFPSAGVHREDLVVVRVRGVRGALVLEERPGRTADLDGVRQVERLAPMHDVVMRAD